MSEVPTPLWSNDKIYEAVDSDRFDVQHNSRIKEVVLRGNAEAIMEEMRDEYEAALAAKDAERDAVIAINSDLSCVVAGLDATVIELEAQLAAKDVRIAELEAELADAN